VGAALDIAAPTDRLRTSLSYERCLVNVPVILILVVIIIAAAAALVLRHNNKQANITRADNLRTHAAAQAQTTLPPVQDRAAEAEAKAEEARVAAERAQAEAEEARVAALQAEAEHEAQIRAADRLDPRVDHKADDYAPQVGGTVDQQPAGPADTDASPDAAPVEDTTETTTETTTDTTTDTSTETTQDPDAPLLPQRNPGTHEMPGKPLEAEGGSGGWFTRKDESDKA
jgi:hypothetical protein